MKPFFSKQRGAFVLGAKCECGHSECDHGSAVKRTGDSPIRLHNDGSCCVAGCDCQGFTWDDWITTDQLAATKPLAACA
jgi:hypothetical protein